MFRPTSTTTWSGSIRPRPRCRKVPIRRRFSTPKAPGATRPSVNAGRPTVLSLDPKGGFGDWTDPKQAYLIQTGPRPFASTYDRVAGGTSHWLGTCLRIRAERFQDEIAIRPVRRLADRLRQARELVWRGRSGARCFRRRKDDQEYLGIKISRPLSDAARSHIRPRTRPSARPCDAIDRRRDQVSWKGTTGSGKSGQKPSGGAQLASPIGIGAPAPATPTAFRSARSRRNTIRPSRLNDAMDTGFVTMSGPDGRQRDHRRRKRRHQPDQFLKYKNDTKARDELPEKGSVKARIFVIAGNAIETPRLLLMSRNGGRTAKGVANSSDMVGRNLMDHPYYVAWGMSAKAALSISRSR